MAMNMSYCRFENTLAALRECDEAMAEIGDGDVGDIFRHGLDDGHRHDRRAGRDRDERMHGSPLVKNGRSDRRQERVRSAMPLEYQSTPLARRCTPSASSSSRPAIPATSAQRRGP